MAHYALIDNQGIVQEVFVGPDENQGDLDWEQHFSEIRGMVCKRTSYNTKGGVHLAGGIAFRKNYAGPGYTYNLELDAFIPPKQFDSWVLNETTCLWESSIPYPSDSNAYEWDEAALTWQLIGPPRV